MPQALHIRHRPIIILILKTNHIRLQLIMKPRPRERLLRRQILIQDMPQILDRRRDDPAPARRAHNKIQRMVGEVLDDGGRDG